MRKVTILKVLVVLFTVLFCILCVTNSVYAYDWSGKLSSIDNATGANDGGLGEKTTNIVGAIINVVRIVATGVAIIMIIVVAMKYMTSAPGDRADIKKHAVPFVVGAIVLFGSSGILSIIQKFASSI